MAVIGIDMDGVLVDIETPIHEAIEREGYHEGRDATQWEFFDQYPDERAGLLAHDIMDTQGFFANAQPHAGAVEGVKRLMAEGHQVFVVSTPWPGLWCAGEKWTWVGIHLPDIIKQKRLVLTQDKTVVRCDFLVDDRHMIEGHQLPRWRQVWAHPERSFWWSEIDRLCDMLTVFDADGYRAPFGERPVHAEFRVWEPPHAPRIVSER